MTILYLMIENSLKTVVHPPLTSVFWWIVSPGVLCFTINNLAQIFSGTQKDTERALPVTPCSLKWWLSFSTDGAAGGSLEAFELQDDAPRSLPCRFPFPLDPGAGHGGGDRHRVGLRRALSGRRWEALKTRAALPLVFRTASTQSFLRCWVFALLGT